jgi:hypothetical protein
MDPGTIRKQWMSSQFRTIETNSRRHVVLTAVDHAFDILATDRGTIERNSRVWTAVLHRKDAPARSDNQHWRVFRPNGQGHAATSKDLSRETKIKHSGTLANVRRRLVHLSTAVLPEAPAGAARETVRPFHAPEE